MTQEQYMQLMAQRQQQRGPSPEQQAMMMQQQMMAEQQSAPGAAGGFMGGLLDSALAGLVPNSMYQNPNDPNNVSASKAGGLIGMIIPMLLAKYGIKNFALPALAKEGSALGRWLGAGTEAAASTQNLARADMLASVLGGGIGGGLAEGPMGGLLGAAGMGAYSKFAGAGKLMGEKDTYGLSKLFEGGKATKPLTKEQKLEQEAIKRAKVKPTPEEVEGFKQRVSKIYDPETKTVDIRPILDDANAGFDDIQWGHIKVGDKNVQITPRTVAEKAFSEEAGEKVIFKKAKESTSKDSNIPTYSPEREVTWKEMYDEMVAPLLKGSKDGSPYIPYKHKKITEGNVGDKYSTSWQEATKIQNKIKTAHHLPRVYSKGEVYDGYTRYVKPIKTTAGTADLNKLSDIQKQVYQAKIDSGATKEEALKSAVNFKEPTDDELMNRAFGG